MAFRDFSGGLFAQVALLFISLTLLAYLLTATNYIAVSSLLSIAVVAQVWHIVQTTRRTNRELARFLDAVRNADFSQSFTGGPGGAGFAELSRALNASMHAFRDSRRALENEVRMLRGLVEQVPVPLISVDQNGRVTTLNNAARRLFGTAVVGKVADLVPFGAALHDAVCHLEPGQRVLIGLEGDDSEMRLAVSVSHLTVGAAEQRLVSLNNIHGELEATELEAWRRIVRVLTHEIMNSITPISSLAKTAADMIADADGDTAVAAGSVPDVRHAVETVARRSEGLVRFVDSYRRLTRVPAPALKRLRLADVFDRLERLVGPELKAAEIRLVVDLAAKGLEVDADPDQIDQALLNLVSNAREAVAGRDDATIWLVGRLSRSGRTVIDVADNGPGVPADISDSIFVPFFTTKRGGSGIGLPLSRQIMRAHNGSLLLRNRAGGGAQFTLRF